MSNIVLIIENLYREKDILPVENYGENVLEFAIERIKKIDNIDKIYFGFEKSPEINVRDVLNIISCHSVSPIQIDDEASLNAVFSSKTDERVENILLFNSASPFVDPELSGKLLSRHIKNQSCFAFGLDFPLGILPHIIHRRVLSKLKLKNLKTLTPFSFPQYKSTNVYLKDTQELKGLNFNVTGPYGLVLFNNLLGKNNGKPLNYETLKSLIEGVLVDLMKNCEDKDGKKHFNRILNRIEKNKKSLTCKSYPLFMHMGLNANCNLRCVTCHHSFVQISEKEYYEKIECTERLSRNRMFRYDSATQSYKKKNQNMALKLYKEIADKIFPYLSEVRFGINGETLLYKELEEVLNCVNHNQVHASIMSNGMLLNEKKVSILLDGNLRKFTFSIDSTRDDLLKKIRNGAELQGIINKVKLLIAEKERRGLTYPSVGFNFTAARENIKDLPKLVEMAASLGVEYVWVQFRYISNFMDPNQSLFFHPVLREEYFGRAREKANRLNIELNIPSSTGRVSDCDIPWTTINISQDGNAVPCCTMNLSRKYGNYSGEDFMGIWNNKHFRKFRKSFKAGSDLEYHCHHCILGDKHNFEDPLRFFGEGHLKKMI